MLGFSLIPSTSDSDKTATSSLSTTNTTLSKTSSPTTTTKESTTTSSSSSLNLLTLVAATSPSSTSYSEPEKTLYTAPTKSYSTEPTKSYTLPSLTTTAEPVKATAYKLPASAVPQQQVETYKPQVLQAMAPTSTQSFSLPSGGGGAAWSDMGPAEAQTTQAPFFDAHKTPILIGIGLVGVVGAVMLFRPRGKSRRR